MHLTYHGVNDAFTGIVEGILNDSIPTIKTSSRLGEVLQIPEPLTLTYRNPLARVLFNGNRDANPFFHLYESLWMLAGCNDIGSLTYYAASYADFVQDDKNPFANGAYGYRWRNANSGESYQGFHAPFDQLEFIIDHLRRQPDSRRAVLSMWTIEDDLMKIETSKDVCCNTHIYFSIRNLERVQVIDSLTDEQVEAIQQMLPAACLDMTVCNRSNDLLFGTFGSDYVNLSFLQEYMAIALGCAVGVYHQFSNNAHVYLNKFEPHRWLPKFMTMHDPLLFDYASEELEEHMHFDLMEYGQRQRFDTVLKDFVRLNKNGDEVHGTLEWSEPFLQRVAQPMLHAFHMHKQRDYEAALAWITKVESLDWQLAGEQWLKKRRDNYKSRQKGISATNG